MRILVVLLLLGVSCGRIDRALHGENWIVVQYDARGEPVTCWTLRNIVVKRDAHGLAWDMEGQTVHISGWYNYVQVEDERWTPAGMLLGVEVVRCNNGRYLKGD